MFLMEFCKAIILFFIKKIVAGFTGEAKARLKGVKD